MSDQARQFVIPDRNVWIAWLVDRCYPKREGGKNKGLRPPGAQQFEENLREQSDQIIKAMYESAKKIADAEEALKAK